MPRLTIPVDDRPEVAEPKNQSTHEPAGDFAHEHLPETRNVTSLCPNHLQPEHPLARRESAPQQHQEPDEVDKRQQYADHHAEA